MGTDKERTLLQPQEEFYKQAAVRFVSCAGWVRYIYVCRPVHRCRYNLRSGKVRLVLFLFFLFIAYSSVCVCLCVCVCVSVCLLCRFTCGAVYYYPGFRSNMQGDKFMADLAQLLQSEQGFEAVLHSLQQRYCVICVAVAAAAVDVAVDAAVLLLLLLLMLLFVSLIDLLALM